MQKTKLISRKKVQSKALTIVTASGLEAQQSFVIYLSDFFGKAFSGKYTARIMTALFINNRPMRFIELKKVTDGDGGALGEALSHLMDVQFITKTAVNGDKIYELTWLGNTIVKPLVGTGLLLLNSKTKLVPEKTRKQFVNIITLDYLKFDRLSKEFGISKEQFENLKAQLENRKLTITQ